MFTLQSLFNKALVSLMLALANAAAVAGPTYHVSVDTAAFAGNGSGHFDFTLAGVVPGAQTIATLSNFSGAFGAETDRSGAVSGALPGLVSLTNTDSLNYLTQAAVFGGIFGFDISFSGDYDTIGGANGATFSLSLFNQALDAYLAMDFVSFSIVPAFGGAPALVDVAADSALATVAAVAAVPEPSELLLMLTGLALMGLIAQRRMR